MRKIKLLLVTLLTISFSFVTMSSAYAKDKINVYMFRGEGCPHCEEALEYFKELEKDEEYSKYYKLVKYEVWYDKDNAELMQKVAKELNEEANGVPYIVIGKKTLSGFSEESKEKIKSAIKEAYESKSYKDIVKQVNGSSKETKKEDNATVPIVITICVGVLVIGGLVLLTKKM